MNLGGTDRGKAEAIKKAEDRSLFKIAMKKIGISVPESGYARSYEDAMKVIDSIGFRDHSPLYSLGGSGGNAAYNMEEYKEYKNSAGCKPGARSPRGTLCAGVEGI